MKRRDLLSLFALSMLSGCASVKSLFGFGPPRAALRTLTIEADPEANANNATALDVVLIFDASVADRLPRSGPEWFQQRDALRKSLATAIEIVSLQVPAATPRFPVALPRRLSDAAAVIAFANYVPAAGWPSMNLSPFESVSLRLLPDGIALAGQ